MTKNILVSFIPYAVVFAFFGILAVIVLCKNMYKKENAEEWKKIKSDTLWKCLETAIPFAIFVCIYRCINEDALDVGDKVFVAIWGFWSLITYVMKHAGER